MKKAVILEIRDGYAAVLTDEGLVEKIPDRQYAIGQEIVLPYSGRRRRAGLYRAAAAAAVIVLAGGTLHYASENAFAYSTVTVSTEDASVELTLNRKDEVVAVKALDEQSLEAAGNMNVSFIKRRPLAETLGELAGEDGQADVFVGSRNEEHRLDLEKRVKKLLPPAEPAAGTEEQGSIQQSGRNPQGPSFRQNSGQNGPPPGSGAGPGPG